MTTDRELMQQALDALNSGRPWPTKMSDDDYRATVDHLRERLAQPEQESVATLCYQRKVAGQENEMPVVLSCNRLPDGVYLVYLYPQPTQQQARKPFFEFRECEDSQAGQPVVQPAQTTRYPLTREQVSQMMQAVGYEAASLQERADFITGIRYAELAHGITELPE